MANSENKKLAVDVIARIDKLEKGMAKAAGTVNKKSAEMESRLKRFSVVANDNVSKAVGGINTALGKLGLAGAIGGGGLAGLAAGFASVAKGVAEIGDEAAKAGIATKTFQEWRFVAEQARIPIDSITDAFKELAIRADEFAVTGKGSAAEAFQRLGLSQEEVKARLKDPAELMLLIIERTRQLKDTAAGVRIFDEAFGGTGGERLVSLLQQGETEIRNQIKAANDLRIVIDEQLITKAAEVDKKFNLIVQTVGQNLKGAIVSAADSLQEFIDGFRAFEDRNTSSLKSRQAELGLKRIDLENSRLETGGSDRLSTRRRAVIDQQLRELAEEERHIVEALSKRTPAMSRTADRTFTPITPTDPKAESARAKAAREAEREAQAVRDLISELDHEYALIGMSAVDQAKANALRQAGAAATAEQRAAIEAKVGAIYAENAALEASKDAAAAATDAARDFAGTLTSGLLNGASAAETLSNALKNIGNRLFDSGLDALFSGNGVGGIFSGLFGGGGGFKPNTTLGGFLGAIPGRATGGPVSAGQPYVVGEKRPELFVPRTSGTIIPRIPEIGAKGGGGSVVVNFNPVIDNRGASSEAVAKTEAALQKLKGELPTTILNTMRGARKTGAWR